jgi:two-component system, OmpR family, sensor histidine kinase MprB
VKLSTRIGLAMTGLVALTALSCAAAAVGVTEHRLDAEIRASIDQVANRVRGSETEAEFTCGLKGFGGDNRGVDADGTDGTDGTTEILGGRINGRGNGRGGGRGRNTPRELLVQCLDIKGTISVNSPSSAIPVTASDVLVATGRAAERNGRVSIDGQAHFVKTIPIAGFGAVQLARAVDERDRVLKTLVGRSALIAGLATLLAFVASWWLSHRIARPLQALTKSTEQIRETRDLDAVNLQPLTTNDEVGRLSASFVSMLDALRDSKRAQARLVQDAGHELRTPLTSVRMNVAMLGRENLTPQKRAELKADIEAELHELTLVTNELVAIAADNARTEAPTPVDVVAVVKAAGLRWEKRSQRSVQLSLRLPTSGEGQFVLISPTALQRIVDNLVSNAVKFSPSDTVIEVALQNDGSHVSFSVRDHGPGIIASDLPHVFDRFFRSDQARAVSGSGLGLAIVKELVERAGGTASASNASDGGAKFEVRFPVLPSE